MIKLDTHNIISIGDEKLEGKQFTRSFYGYPISAYDHTILVYHKGVIQQKQWKDIGSGQYIMKYRNLQLPNTYVLGVARLGYDIHCMMNEESQSFVNTANVDTVVSDFVNKIFGTSKHALVMPQYDSLLQGDSIYSFLFGIALGHGKWYIKDEKITPLKITIPLTSSLLGRKEFFVALGSALQDNSIVHSMQFNHNGIYDIVQITLHDGQLLQTFAHWLNPVVKITQISTLENTQKVYNALEQYASEQGLVLPITKASELIVLESD